MIKDVAAVLGNEQVGKSVVVVIAPDAAQAVTGAGNAGLFGDVGECAIAVVTIKRIANGNAAVVQIAAVHKVNVLPAVAIEVGHADSRTKFFPVDGDAVIALEVDKPDAGCRRSIGELNGSRPCLGVAGSGQCGGKYPQEQERRKHRPGADTPRAKHVCHLETPRIMQLRVQRDSAGVPY